MKRIDSALVLLLWRESYRTAMSRLAEFKRIQIDVWVKSVQMRINESQMRRGLRMLG